MFYVVGLGNPGKQYTNTRHNIGWLVLDAFATANGAAEPEAVSHWHARVRRVSFADAAAMLVYPETFMNRSGETVRAILHDDPDGTVVLVHDDVALPLGRVQVVVGRGTGGHNGVQSVYDQTKRKDFARVRVGVAPVNPFTGVKKTVDGATLRRHVLGSFTLWERSRMAATCDAAVATLETLLVAGPAVAMNRHN